MSGLTVQDEGNNMVLMKVAGLLKKSEFDAAQAEGAKKLNSGDTIRLLIILEDFKGWDKGVDWGDMSFYAEHGDKIVKIAIVGDPKWEAEFKMFVGAGFRIAPVKFFPSNQLTQARTWLA